MVPTSALLPVLAAIVARVAWVLAVPTRPVGDFAMYLEAAAHLRAHGALDPEFVYMPGYVLLLATVQALGGGVLAAKLVGAVLGGLGAALVYGLAHHLWDARQEGAADVSASGGRERRAAVTAAWLYALWPGGIAVASVTGTDMPAGFFLGAAALALAHFGPRRPVLAAVLFGVGMGLAAWIRAVALPLALLGGFYFLAVGTPWRRAARLTALAAAVALAMLGPWAVRNAARYGELFVTDSHGGLTALVGANPNTEGAYSRSLNRMFREATGHDVLAEPHREVDRVAYRLAREWTAFSPGYSLGLAALRAERLLARERPLLYWPIFRSGVLPAEKAAWFGARRRGLEVLADGFWALLAIGFLAGTGLALARRRWAALTLLPLKLALVGIYVLYFSEARYHIPIALLMFPAAGVGWIWLADLGRALAARRTLAPAVSREALIAGGLTLAVLIAWPLSLRAGEALRERHRWAVQVCRVDGQARLCKWRAASRERPNTTDRSGLRGVWNGVGVLAPPAKGELPGEITVESEIALEPGKYRLQATIDVAPAVAGTPGPTGRAEFGLGRDPMRIIVDLAEVRGLTAAGKSVAWDREVDHAGGPLAVWIHVSSWPQPGVGAIAPARLWLSDLSLARVAGK